MLELYAMIISTATALLEYPNGCSYLALSIPPSKGHPAVCIVSTSTKNKHDGLLKQSLRKDQIYCFDYTSF
jgi:hypothetical protein